MASSLAAAPQSIADARGLLLAIEDEGRKLSLIDSESLAALHRLEPPLPLQGEPQFTRDGSFAFLAAADGWILKYDLSNLTLAARVQSGLQVRGLAVSGDGRWVLAGHASPARLVLFDTDLKLVRTYPAASQDGSTRSAVYAVHTAAARKCFVVSFDTLPQLWEISYDPAAEPIFEGLVHDYRMGEAIATRGFLGVRRTPLDRPFAIAAFDESQRHAIGSPREPGGARDSAAPPPLQVVNLDVRRAIAQIASITASSGAQSAWFTHRGLPLLAIAGPPEPGSVRFVEPGTWRVMRTARAGDGDLFIRTHARTPHLWTASATGGHDGVTLTLIDKETLEAQAVLRVAGRWPARVAFTHGGSRAIVGCGGQPGLLAVYDARTGEEIRRAPLTAPAAIYAVLG